MKASIPLFLFYLFAGVLISVVVSILAQGLTLKQALQKALVIIVIILGVASAAIMTGCSSPYKVQSKLDIDERMMQPCPATPKLKSSDDTEVLALVNELSAIYVKCALEKRSMTDIIRKYNEGVVKRNEELSEDSRN